MALIFLVMVAISFRNGFDSEILAITFFSLDNCLSPKSPEGKMER
jgi:hypothetical protein